MVKTRGRFDSCVSANRASGTMALEGVLKETMSSPKTISAQGSAASGLHHASLVNLLRWRAERQPGNDAYTFLEDRMTKEVGLTYAGLDLKARAIGAWLQSANAGGERVLLLYPPGLDYIAAFFGCMYAKAVAVPAYPPRPNRTLDRLQSIVADARPVVLLTVRSIASQIESLADGPSALKNLILRTTDDIEDGLASQWKDPNVDGHALAFLQYTSGSTARPKGVMVSHSNLLHNERLIERAFQQTEDSVIVGWLPLFHDMGLIGNVLQPLYVGARCVLMSPLSFLQAPMNWLGAISRYRATTSGGPDFAYDLCVRKLVPDKAQALDLSSWTVAFNGSEPIHKETLDRFAAAFEPYGFRREAFYPCYGLAEATLFVSGGQKMAGPAVLPVKRTALAQNHVTPAAENTDAQDLVSCGRGWLDQRIVIVDPETSTQRAPDTVGEIWVSSPSVAQGYWGHPEASAHTFRAHLADTGEGPFLRTGDLGFIDAGQLYVTGRLKDLIIIRGRNHYPQDIEKTVEKSNAALRPGGGAAFSLEIEGEERLIIVQEVDRSLREQDAAEVIGAIREAVAEEHELQVYAVVLSKAGSVPKTSSGKVQRHACRAAFAAGTLQVIESDVLNQSEDEHDERREYSVTREGILAIDSPQEQQSELARHLQCQVAGLLKIPPSRVPLTQSLTRLGLDSLKAIELQNQIESGLGVFLPMSGFLRGMSVSQLASQLSVELRRTSPAPPVASFLAPEGVAEHPASFGQHRLWFLDQMEPGNASYNIFTAFRLAGRLSVQALEQAITEVVSRHEALRTTFAARNGQPAQVVNPRRALTLPFVDLRLLSGAKREAETARLVSEEAGEPFDLASGPLYRVAVCCLGDEESLLLVSMHHIISDGWSVGIFLREFTALYGAYVKGELPPLARPRFQYSDFARWQRQSIQGEALDAQLQYWKRKFAVPPGQLELAADRPRSPGRTARGACHRITISKDRAERLKALGAQEGSTLFMTSLAVFKLLLHSYSGQDDIIVGTPIAGRNRAEFEDLIGFFLNTLVLRTDVSGNPTFQELLGRVRNTALEAYDHQDFPLERLVSEVAPDRTVSSAPLYQAWFVLQVGYIPATSLPQLTLSYLETDLHTTKFDLALNLTDTPEGIRATFEYNRDLFEMATIVRLAGDFETILDHVSRHPDLRVDQVEEILRNDDRDRLQKRERYESALHQKLKSVKRRVVPNQ